MSIFFRSGFCGEDNNDILPYIGIMPIAKHGQIY
jgi:hypothetical protein